MKLETICQDCREPVTATLPDITTEAEASALASRLYCVPCAVRRVLLVTEGDNIHKATKTQPQTKPEATGAVLGGLANPKGSSGNGRLKVTVLPKISSTRNF